MVKIQFIDGWLLLIRKDNGSMGILRDFTFKTDVSPSIELVFESGRHETIYHYEVNNQFPTFNDLLQFLLSNILPNDTDIELIFKENLRK